MYGILEAGIPKTPNPTGTWLSTVGMIVIIFVVFYFFGIRPQKSRKSSLLKCVTPCRSEMRLPQ